MTAYRQHDFRPGRAPATALPLGARSVGHYRVEAGFAEIPMTKHFVQVFWGIEGQGWLGYPEGRLPLGPGQVLVYLPGDEHRVAAGDGSLEYRWWTMDGPLAEAMACECGLSSGRLFEPGPAPESVFEELTDAIRDITPEGERRASALAYRLVTLAAGTSGGSRQQSDPVVRQALELIHRNWSQAGIGVETIARRVGWHRSRFSRHFRARLGVTPIAYLTNLRVQHALSMLKQTGAPIGEIAQRCGFADPNYFARAIRRVTGISPTAFRKS